MQYNHYKRFFFLIVFCTIFTRSLTVSAQVPVTYGPKVIDLKAAPRETVKSTIHLTQPNRMKTTVYGFINPIYATTSEKTSSSFMKWIQFPRSIPFSNSASRDLDLTLTVAPYVAPGNYHAEIRFAASADSQADAELSARSREPLLLNIQVIDTRVQYVQLHAFMPTESWFRESPARVTFSLENTGSQISEITGSVSVYDKTGTEVKEIPIPPFTLTIGEKKNKTVVIDEPVLAGRYKTMLNLRYGENGSKSLHDTTYFWILNMKRIAALFFAGLLSVLLIVNVYYTLRIEKKYR